MDFGEMYQLYFKDIYLFLKSLSENASLAEELTQETFVKALKHIDRFDGTKDIRAWLFTIARNSYYSYCKKNTRTVPMEQPEQGSDSGVTFCEMLEQEETVLQIHRFLHTMAEPYKEVFTLRVFGELSFRSIGTLFGKSEGWARVTFYRVKKQIIEYMERGDLL